MRGVTSLLAIASALLLGVSSASAQSAFDAKMYLNQGDRYNCDSFASQHQSQQVLREDPSDPNRLDQGGVAGVACETTVYDDKSRDDTPLSSFVPASPTAAPSAPAAPASAGCQYVLGFALLHNLIPAVVGPCSTEERHNGDNGDGLQNSVNGGLMVWRKADNWTAFTDGHRTWINGPFGIAQRLNTQRYSWEANPDGLAAA